MTVREILRLAIGGGIKFENPPPDTETYAPGAPLPGPELIESLRQRATAGEAEAQRELGILTYRGRGVPEDRAEAFKWLTLASRQGDEKAVQSLEYIGPTVTVEEAYEGRCRISQITGEPLPASPEQNDLDAESRSVSAPTQEESYTRAIEAMRAQGLLGRDEDIAQADSQPNLRSFELPPRPPGPPPPARPLAWALSGAALLGLVGVIAGILYFIGRDQRDVAHVPGQGSYSLQSGAGGSGKITLSTTLPELRASAEAGNARAQFEYGLAHARGIGMERNLEKAAEWYRKAALQRDIGSMNNLGVCYIQGTGVKQDFTQAYLWLHLAAQGGSVGSGRNRDQLSLYMTADQIADAMKQATALRQQWADAGLLGVTPPTPAPAPAPAPAPQ